MTIADKLEELARIEMAPGGLLDRIASIKQGQMDLFPDADYPVLTMSSGSGDGDADQNAVRVSFDIELESYVIARELAEAEALRDLILIDIPNAKGIIPFILKYSGLIIDDVEYQIKIGRFTWNSGFDKKARKTAGITFPLKVETMLRIGF